MKMPHEVITPAQEAAELRLVKAGFRVTKVTFQYDELPSEGALIFMSRHRSYSMHLATVEPDGKVNGESVKDYLESFTK